MPKKKKKKIRKEKINYDKIKHTTSVDQSDRQVPYNLRQSGSTKVEMLISTRVRKSPYWHLSMKAGCWRATVYNRVYHPRGYVKPEKGGAMVEYKAIKNHVTMWNVAVERQIRVKGPDAEKFTDYVITRDATKISPMRARYVILCNAYGGILNDPILLRISKDEFWFSLSDSDIAATVQIQKTQSIESVGTVVTETATRTEKILPDTTPEEQYKFDLSFIKVGDYETAEFALREFVDNNSKHQLAGNAQYWYGETFRIRQLYQDAATAYLDGYQNYPKSNKAPVNMHKLGVMLVQIGE